LLESVVQSATGTAWCKRHSGLYDEAVKAAYRQASESVGGYAQVAVVATGGYGRQEMSPGSDLDLTVIPLDEAAEGLDEFVKVLFRSLHDTIGNVFGVEVGYAFRIPNDAPALDAKSRTAMVDARLIAGSVEALEAFQRSFRASFQVGEFLLERVSERAMAFLALHDTPLVTEPNLKEGAGGLRCFQTANWIRSAIGEPALPPSADYETVLYFRNLLHRVSGKKLDALSRQRQAEIADLAGLDPYDMMSRLAGAMLGLHSAYWEAHDLILESSFTLAPRVSTHRGTAQLGAQASLSEGAAGVALATQLGLSVAPVTPSANVELDGPVALHALASG
jgi:[protein-PII] uridylyltransferase